MKAAEKQKPSFYGATGIIAAGTFLSRILGLVREQVFAYFFGAGASTDAFQIAFRIPNLLRDLFAEGAMSSALVPTYTKVRKEEGEKKAWDLVSNAISILGIVLVIVAVLGILFSSTLVSYYAPAFKEVPGKFEMAVDMTQMLWPFLPMVGMAAIWMGILNSRERFATPALAPSFFNMASILSAFTICPLVTHFMGWPAIYGMAIGAVVGGFLQWWIQVPSLKKEGFTFRWNFQLRNPALHRMMFLMGAGTFGLAATQINIFVNSLLASSQGDGAVSWLNYAFRLMQFPIGVFGVAISTANLTRVSKEAANGDSMAVMESIRTSLRMVFVLTIPSAVGLAFLGIPIISVIYEHGKFDSHDTYSTAMALAGYALGLVAYSAIKVLVPVLYALGMTSFAMISSGLSVALNVILCFLFVKEYSFVGLAFASSIAAILNALVILLVLQRRLKQINFRDLGKCLILTLSGSLLMAIFVYYFQGLVGIVPFRPIPLTAPWQNATFLGHLAFLVAALVGAVAVYGIYAKILGLKELDRFQEVIWKRLKRTKDRI
jgi:putative peptidoglycan lipid II flippase